MVETAGQQGSLYIDLLKKVLLNTIYRCPHAAPWGEPVYNEEARRLGRDWPRDAHTMVGEARLNNLEACVRSIIADGVPGDLIEAGVWRGGCAILMRAILKECGVTDRIVWAADSFQGLPPPDEERFPADAGLHLEGYGELAIPQATVEEHFRRYGLLDEQVRFLPGWFRDTLPYAPMSTLSLIRLDGDLYESTYVALEALYPKLSAGGYLIVDDYRTFAPCRQAADDYRAKHGVEDEIVDIDWTGVYWRKTETDSAPG